MDGSKGATFYNTSAGDMHFHVLELEPGRCVFTKTTIYATAAVPQMHGTIPLNSTEVRRIPVVKSFCNTSEDVFFTVEPGTIKYVGDWRFQGKNVGPRQTGFFTAREQRSGRIVHRSPISVPSTKTEFLGQENLALAQKTLGYFPGINGRVVKAQVEPLFRDDCFAAPQ